MSLSLELFSSANKNLRNSRFSLSDVVCPQSCLRKKNPGLISASVYTLIWQEARQSNPTGALGWHKSSALSCKCHKHTIKRVCATSVAREAGPMMHNGLPAPQADPGKTGLSRSAQCPGKVRRRQNKAEPWVNQPREGNGDRIHHLCQILTPSTDQLALISVTWICTSNFE